ncbi:hypothetical protein NDU88_006411 [Pleurodeles waltl]|uniref:Uncharacterized protein n=1 Tax=Pleurodeles waltl TaxID=8319 RepID=A0AAV7PLB6_PLEWA|nr:hypothetical protein NDU88_006411 [Pleurodeles waltl]
MECGPWGTWKSQGGALSSPRERQGTNPASCVQWPGGGEEDQWRRRGLSGLLGFRRLPCGEQRRGRRTCGSCCGLRSLPGLDHLVRPGGEWIFGSCAEASNAWVHSPTSDGRSTGLEWSGELELRTGVRGSGRRCMEDPGESTMGRDPGTCPVSSQATSTAPLGPTIRGGASPHCAECVGIGRGLRTDY